MDRVPTFDELLNPLVHVIVELGGSGSIPEICEKVVEYMGLPDRIVEELHNREKGNQTELQYRLAWARTYLKKYGVIENSSRGVWSLTSAKGGAPNLDPREVVRTVRELDRKAKEEAHDSEGGEAAMMLEPPEGEETWREDLRRVLITAVDPATFERLIQRMLRESGFIQVEVTGRSGDGGIDGKGILRLGGLMGFHVLFQCKKYQGVVSAAQIRDFRGALVGRGDKGLFITTGTFSREALKEAARDGAPPIDLMDGVQLADKLKELSLGIRTKLIEEVIVDVDWFNNL